ncbi:MAG: Hsp70 family protein, partial [Planctomycetaceae bacterium]
MSSVPAVGIDLGTTYSSIAWLNEQSEPVTIPNLEGESSTPSVVMYLEGREVVGQEALDHSIIHPDRVIHGSKRFMGADRKVWSIDGRAITPVEVATAIVRKLLNDARAQIGPVQRAVITVPAQFSEKQRLATIEAGQRAGLTQVDLINEPVAAALCYVLGAEGLWFSELAEDQRILVYDLGGGTFDLSLVSYQQDRVQVLSSTGDLHLGGMDWNQRLLGTIADQFQREVGLDLRGTPASLQRLHREVEQCKRVLSRQTRGAIVVEHAGHRKTYQIEREQFNQLTADLLERTRQITQGLINQHRAGSSHLDVTIVSTGGSSRMPMIDAMLKTIRGTTHSKVLSPDQSIAHGAAYYAGMLLSNDPAAGRFTASVTGQRLARFTQSSVNARSLGILIRDVDSGERVPFYLIPPNTPLPATAAKTFGTVHADQRRVTLSIVESGASSEDAPSAIGVCSIEGLPPGLPAETPIEVSISYDGSARVSVSARELTSGKAARVELTRESNLVTPTGTEEPRPGMTSPGGRPAGVAAVAPVPPVTTPRTASAGGPPPLPAA